MKTMMSLKARVVVPSKREEGSYDQKDAWVGLGGSVLRCYLGPWWLTLICFRIYSQNSVNTFQALFYTCDYLKI